MADVLDIVLKIASDVSAAVQPIVGTTYAVQGVPDAATFGPTRTVPPIEVMPGNILLEELMNRLEQGKAQIQIEAEETDAPCVQYLAVNEDSDPAVIPQPLIVVTPVGNVCTLSGTIQAGDVIGIALGMKGAGYSVLGTDTLSSIATNISANATTAGIPTSAVGSVITVAGNQIVKFNIGTTWNRTREFQRRRKVFFATLYAPTAYDRSTIGKVLEIVYGPGSRLTLPDGSVATLVAVNGLSMQSSDYDEQQRDTTMMRRVRWLFEFITIQTISVTTVVAVPGSLTAGVPYSPATFPGPPLPSQL